MSNIRFIISTLEQEKDTVLRANSSMYFLTSKKITFTLPREPIEKEYDLGKYKDFKEKLEMKWKEKGAYFLEKLLTFFREPPDTRFTVLITNYGNWGSYDLRSGTVVLNMNATKDCISIIEHELAHIMIEPFIRRYNIDFEKKESIVETVLSILSSA